MTEYDSLMKQRFVDEFRCNWTNYNDNNQKDLRGEDHKQAKYKHYSSSGN